jgi:phosphate-selective porin
MRRLPFFSVAVSAVVTLVASASSAQEIAPPTPTEVPPESKPDQPGTSSAPEPIAAAPEAPVEEEDKSLAGRHGGVFFLRDKDDEFRLYFGGRAQIDSYNYFGPGVADTTLKSTIFLRRIRPELTGEFYRGMFQWMLAGDFGATANDNPTAGTETSAAGAGKAPTDTSGRYASAQTAGIRALATDVFINVKTHGLFQIQMGQYDAPFTMENRTSDKYLQFMERSLAIRAMGIPTNKEIGVMFWGETKDKLFFYSAGAFNGDGQGKLNPDNRADVMGRVFFHPLITSMKGALKDLQIGGSFRYGVRDNNYVNYDYAALTTQGNYTFWKPTYNGSSAGRPTHVIPSGKQTGIAFELRVPVDMFDLTSEVVVIKNETREAVDGFQATNTERFGAMKGASYYVQLGFWPLGSRDINGAPGYENPTHIDFKKPDTKAVSALQLLVKFEQLMMEYDSASRSGVADAKNIDGKIKVNAFSLGANYWFSKHIRFTVNYVVNMFPKSEPGGVNAQRAVAPGNTIAAGINDDARSSAHVLHELLFRAAVAF